MGLIRHSAWYCPNCNSRFLVEAGILADDQRYRCDNCGAMIDIKMKWGKIKSISLAPTIKEEYKGYGGTSTHRYLSDEFMQKQDEWWRAHKND